MNTCLNESCSSVQIRKHLSDTFAFKNDTKEGDALLLLLFNFDLEYPTIKVHAKKNRVKKVDHISFGSILRIFIYLAKTYVSYYKETNRNFIRR
jgi:hypothetical protein